MKWMLCGVLALAACESRGGAGATTGGLQTYDGGVKPLPGEKCGLEAVCSSSAQKTYKQCQAPGPPCVARYITNDGQAFNCATCSDCSAAAGLVTGWCGPGDEMCKNAATRNDCLDCCTAAHQTGSDFYLSTYQTCLCDNPGDCALDCGTDFCATGTLSDIFCQFCIQSSTCDPANKCMTNSDCSAYLDCAMTCP